MGENIFLLHSSVFYWEILNLNLEKVKMYCILWFY